MSIRTRGVLVWPAVAVLALTGCADDTVALVGPPLSPAERAACGDLVDVLPETLGEQQRRDVEPADAPGAAWGDDPALVLTCGVDVPDGFDRFAACVEVNGVGWFAPESDVGDTGQDLSYTAVGYEPLVHLHVPASYDVEVGAAALAELAAPVDETLRLVQPCR